MNGIYRCEIPVSMGPPIAYQNIYIGVYTASTGELYMYTEVNYIPQFRVGCDYMSCM